MITICRVFVVFALVAGAGFAFAQPINDTCPGFAITSLPYTYSGSTQSANSNYAYSCGSAGTIVYDVVFRLTLPYSASVTASLCSGTLFNTELLIRTGDSCPGTSSVACNINGCGIGLYQRGRTTFNAQAGVTYFIIVGGNPGFTTNRGNYSLALTENPPLNDTCPGFTVSSLPYTYDGDNAYAQTDYGLTCGASGVRDVVFTLSPLTCPTSVTVSTCVGSSFPSEVYVRIGGACPGTSSVSCDVSSCAGWPSGTLTFTAAPDTVYFIILAGNSAFTPDSGSYRLTISGTAIPPSNDVCPGTLISSLPYTDTGNTICANDNYLYMCSAMNARDVVYTLDLPNPAMVLASLCGSFFNTQLAVRTGGSCPGSTSVTCNNDSCGLQSQVVFTAAANTNYYLFVDGVAEMGTYTLNVTSLSPPNDHCPGTIITSLPYSVIGTTANSSNDFADPCPGGTQSNDVVYTLDFPECHLVSVSACGSGFNPRLQIRYSDACPGNILDTCSDQSCSSPLRFVAAGGITRYVVVDVPGAAGQFTLNVIDVTASDTCPGTLISSLPYSDTGTTLCSHNDYVCKAENLNWPYDSNDVVYHLNLSECTTVSAAVSGLWTSLLYVCQPNDTSCAGELIGYVTGSSALNFDAVPGEDYYLFVEGTADYTLNVTGTPNPVPNDACPGTTITLPFNEHRSTCSAHNDFDFTCSGEDTNDVVYHLHSTQCQSVRIALQMQDRSYSSQIIVRTGGSCPGNETVSCSVDTCNGCGNSLSFGASANTDYYIIVDGLADVGSFDIFVQTTGPLNDVCPAGIANVVPFPGFSGTTTCANDDYTLDGIVDGNEVVYELNFASPPADDCPLITVSLAPPNGWANFDTRLQVRGGGTCPGIHLIAYNDDFNGSLQSEVSFYAREQTPYYLVVGGNGETGDYNLEILSNVGSDIPPNDVCPGEVLRLNEPEHSGCTLCARDDYTLDGVYDTSEVVFALELPTDWGCREVTAGAGGNYAIRVSIRSGGVCPGDHLVAYSDWNNVHFWASEGTPYYLLVGGQRGATGCYSVSAVPGSDTNDQACPGNLINTLPFWGQGSTVCAPNHYHFSCGSSIDTSDAVYHINLPFCQTVTVSLCGSFFNTVLLVRRGGNCPGDEAVICNDDYCGTSSQVTFIADANTDYYVIIDGNGEVGNFGMCINGVPCGNPLSAVNDLVVSATLTGDVYLDWSPTPNANGYNIYRGETSGFPLDSAHRIATTPYLHYPDFNSVNVPFSRRFYVVTSYIYPATCESPELNAIRGKSETSFGQGRSPNPH